MSKVLYIAGPMTGIPHFNFPLFDAVSASLRADGFTIISPAETDHERTRAAAMESLTGSIADLASVEGAESWGDCLARDVKMLADGVVGLETDAQLRARMQVVLQSQIDTKAHDDGAAPVEVFRAVTLLKIEGIALLPNWEKSRGARLEAFVGLLTGKEYFTVDVTPRAPAAVDTVQYILTHQSVEWVQHMLALSWADGIKMHAPIPYAYSIP